VFMCAWGCVYVCECGGVCMCVWACVRALGCGHVCVCVCMWDLCVCMAITFGEIIHEFLGSDFMKSVR
jgi:hypothetical protein